MSRKNIRCNILAVPLTILVHFVILKFTCCTFVRLLENVFVGIIIIIIIITIIIIIIIILGIISNEATNVRQIFKIKDIHFVLSGGIFVRHHAT